MTTTLIAQQPHRPAHPQRPTGHRRVDHAGGFADRVILMPVTEPTDGQADDDVLHELAEHGLRHYVAQVAATVGAGSGAAWCEWSDAPSAYIALECGLPGYPDRDAALTWAAERGWAVAVETACGEDLLITAFLDGDVLPPPQTVAAWVRAVLAGRHADAGGRSSTAVGADLVGRLADWAVSAT